MTASTKALEVAQERFFTASTPGRAPASDEQREAVLVINQAVVNLAALIDDLTPNSRNKSLALTALEDVSMRANRAIFATGPSA